MKQLGVALTVVFASLLVVQGDESITESSPSSSSSSCTSSSSGSSNDNQCVDEYDYDSTSSEKADFDSNNEDSFQCGIYLATSSILNAGFG